MKKIIVILLVLGFVVPSFAISEAERERNRQELIKELQAQNKDKKINRDIPKFPPNFLELSKIVKFKIDDCTEGLKADPLGKKFKYSAIWRREFSISKKWDELSKEKQEKFIKLRNKIIDALKAGVQKNGGVLKIKKFNIGMYENSGMIDASWMVTHKENPLFKIWSVHLVSAYNLSIKKPYINIYIAHLGK